MGAPSFPPVISSRPPLSFQTKNIPGGTENNHPRENNADMTQHDIDQQSLETTYTSLIQEYLQVMCLDNATFLAERMVASCRSTNAYYLLGVCHYRSRAPQRALSVLSSSSGGTKYHHSATIYLMAKCCFELQQYSRAEGVLLEATRSDYKEYKANRNLGNNSNTNNNIEGDGNSLMSMDEWLIETSPCPIPNGAAGLYLLGNICRRSNRRRRAMEYYRMSLQLDPLMWVSYEALCEMGATDIDPTSVFGVRPTEIDQFQDQCTKNQQYAANGAQGETMPLQEKSIHMTPHHHHYTPPTPTIGAATTGSARPMDLVSTPQSFGPKTSLFQTAQKSSIKPGTAADTGEGGAILPNQLQFDTPNLTPIPMQQDASFAHPHSAVSLNMTRGVGASATVGFVDSYNPHTIRRAKHVAARLYYQPTPETPQYCGLTTMTMTPSNSVNHNHMNSAIAVGATGVHIGAASSTRMYLRGKSALWSNCLLESSTVSETPLRRGGRPSDISTTRRPRALFLSENRSTRQNKLNGTNSATAGTDEDDQLLIEDEENYHHRSINSRRLLGRQEGDDNVVMDHHDVNQHRTDDSEQPNIMMMTEESDSNNRILTENEKPAIGNVEANNHVPHQEIAMTLEEDNSMEKHDGSVQKILELFCLLGAGYWRLCQFKCRDSLQLFSVLPHIHHNTGWVLHQEGRAYFEMAEYQNAQRCLELMQGVEPDRMKGLDLLSTVLWQLKKEVELAHLAQRTVDFDRLSPEAWCVVGNCFSLQKEHETALVFFGRSLQLDPSFTYTHTLSGYEYMANEDFDKAMACFRNGIRLDERHYNAWYGMGAIYHRQEKYDLAEYHFQRAVQINPQSSVLRCNLGMSQYSNGKPIEALNTLAEAFRLDPHNPQARFQRATIYIALNRPEEALKELEKVRDAAPREATVHFAMGKVLKRLGRPEQAMRCFLTALDLDPKDNQLIKSAMDKLEEPDIVDEEVAAF